MLEVELKSVVSDIPRHRAIIEAAGATLVFAGRLEDRRYDLADGSLTARDNVLRVRTYRDANTGSTRSQMDWKGPTHRRDGYKLREELEARVEDADSLVAILHQLGYRVAIAVDRDIAQYELDGTMIRFEHYPRMDDLVEVEGSPDQIERAISSLTMPRDGFSSDRLSDFSSRFEKRTGTTVVLSFGAL